MGFSFIWFLLLLANIYQLYSTPFEKSKLFVYLVKNRRSIVLVIPSLIETFGTS